MQIERHIIPAAILINAMIGGSLFAVEQVDFAHEVLPLLQKHCAKCHSNGRYEGAISIDSRESVLESGIAEPGASDDSSLIYRITTDDSEIRMPLDAPPLTDDEIDVLRRWVDSGMTWQEGFTFRKKSYVAPLKPRRPALPATDSAHANPIDRIVFAYWQEHGVTPSKPLSDGAFYRRASLDLVGLLPAVRDVTEFETNDDLDKRIQLVRQLLEYRVAYADHWLSFWNDHLRNDYAGTGYINGGRKQITGWLYRALVDNMCYDQFVRELVNPNEASEGFANGFVWRGQVNASQRPELQFAQNVGQVFLGVNLKCASCHDSFVDQWKLTDSYGLAAIFSSEPLEIHRCDVPTGKIAEPYFLFPTLGKVDPNAPREERLAMLAEMMTSGNNGRLTRTIVNRLWDRLMGRALVYPVDSLGSPPWSEDLLDFLASDLSDHGYDLKHTLELIATSQVYRFDSVPWDPAAPVEDYVFCGPAPKRMTAEQFVDAFMQITGIAPAKPACDDVFGERIADPSDLNPCSPFVRAALIESTPLMRSLGRPNREQIVTSRPAEMTTLEAIEMSNGQPLAKLLSEGAEQVLGDHPHWSANQLAEYLFTRALSRPPTKCELRDLYRLAGSQLTHASAEDMLWCIVMLPEFQVVR